ncbi:hypothetical protein M426DRAFT_319526 [Hypoxylon sp. CI-4A]|nr:hypothetical protein M426DRAFT_319526 [Hypoxylon sp. CI-4A]
MVQYLHTPWRDRAELLRVRQQFYPSPPPTTNAITASGSWAGFQQDRDVRAAAADVDEDDYGQDTEARTKAAKDEEAAKQHAVSRVSMWMQRGGCPHLVESTALLMAAVLSDLHETRTRANSSSYAIRAAYSAAFSRFVTGLLDSQQDKQRKMSMYSVAKTIGLPATFVELRHQATHEQLPSLSKLRTAAKKALAWIWDYYWKNLPGGGGDGNTTTTGNEGSNSCRGLLLRYLGEEGESAAQNRTLQKQLKQWDDAVLLQTLAEVGDSSGDPKIIGRSLRLSQAILDGDFSLSSATKGGDTSSTSSRNLDNLKAGLKTSSGELDVMETASWTPSNQAKGWSRYEGPWKSKPIGVV